MGSGLAVKSEPREKRPAKRPRRGRERARKPRRRRAAHPAGHTPDRAAKAPPAAARRPYAFLRPRKGAELHVFAYGSLIWNPRLPPQARRPRADPRLPPRPLALFQLLPRHDAPPPAWSAAWPPAARASGLSSASHRTTARRSWPTSGKREILSPGVYHARRLTCRSGGRRLQAVTFVLNPAHPQYAGHLTDAERGRHPANGAGQERDKPRVPPPLQRRTRCRRDPLRAPRRPGSGP